MSAPGRDNLLNAFIDGAVTFRAGVVLDDIEIVDSR